MRKTFMGLVLLSICIVSAAQQTLNNDAIIKLVKAGLSDDLIVSTINTQSGTYDTSTDGLIALKSGGASDKVVGAILSRSAGGAAAATASAAATAPVGTNPDDPTAPHEAGIYIYNDSAPAGSKMTMLEPSNYTQSKTGGVFASAMTYGIAKVKVKAVIRGAHSNMRTNSDQPVFYFYFEQRSAGLSYGSIFGGTSTPNEYTLLKFDVKGDSRETLTASANAFGASGGTDDKATTAFTFSKLRPGVYKAVLKNPLQPGEYGFVVSSYSRVFDFGRD